MLRLQTAAGCPAGAVTSADAGVRSAGRALAALSGESDLLDAVPNPSRGTAAVPFTLAV